VVGTTAALFLLISKYGFTDVLAKDFVVLDTLPRNHHLEISECKFSDLHMPRRVFGDFVRTALDEALERSPRSGYHLELKKDEVTEIARESTEQSPTKDIIRAIGIASFL
jgi:hypothetical protein